MIRINLLPVRQARKRYGGALQLVLLVLVWAFTAVVIWLPIPIPFNAYSMGEQVRGAELQLKQTNDKIVQFEKIIGQVSEYEAKRSDLDKIKAIIDGLAAGRTGPVRMLDDLAVRTPKKLWLTTVKNEKQNVFIAGEALTHDEISVLMNSLDKSPFFRNVKLTSTSRRNDEKREVTWYTFEITANVTYMPRS